MKYLTTSDYLDIVSVMADVVVENESYFCELDSKAGDGDFGTSLAKGFKAIKENWEDLNKEDIGSFMRACGMIIAESCGGVSGPIWGAAFTQAGRYAKGKNKINIVELSELYQSMVDGIQKTGGAEIGDKTLLDALIPAVESLKGSALRNEDIISSMRKFVEEAVNGAESTKGIVARKGRASYVGERSLGFPDPGAMAVAIIHKEILNRIFLR